MSGTSPLAVELLPKPKVENARVEGNTLVWESLTVADGYNIYKDCPYLDSVKGRASYQLSEAGRHDVVAFEDVGHFGVQYDHHEQFVPDVEQGVNITIDYYMAIVQRTYVDQNSGESCIAVCPLSQGRSCTCVWAQLFQYLSIPWV